MTFLKFFVLFPIWFFVALVWYLAIAAILEPAVILPGFFIISSLFFALLATTVAVSISTLMFKGTGFFSQEKI